MLLHVLGVAVPFSVHLCTSSVVFRFSRSFALARLACVPGGVTHWGTDAWPVWGISADSPEGVLSC